MQIVKWIFIALIWFGVFGFFHYTLPQKDVVRITDTYEKRVDFGYNTLFWAGGDAASATDAGNRDVFFIQTRQAGSDAVMVYRNEDTGWGWPPYFKFDTSNLQAEAADAKSTIDAPRYAIIKHYGWRNELFSIFPNAVSMRLVDGPDVQKGLPWMNIVVLTLFAAAAYAVWVRWRRFRVARIDPALEEFQDNWEAAGDAIERQKGRLGRWIASLRSR